MKLSISKLGSRTVIGLAIVVIAMMLCVTNAFAAVDEQEPNDTYGSANLIKVGQTVYGYHEYYDKDYFVFTAPLSGTVTIKGWLDSHETPNAGFVSFDVYDSNMNHLLYISDDLDKPTGDSGKFGVTYGKKYYIVAEVYSDWKIGTYHFSTSYYIGPTTISKLSAKDNAFYVKWNKKDKASFYQIRYTKKSTYEDYGWAKAKKIKVSKKYGSKTIKKLSNKKKYYVEVRVARTIDGKTYYSSWSKRKIITTK